jgi:predicted  nucleic acid-binding Zn-ribbon protein
MDTGSLVAVLAIVGSFGATVIGPFLSYRAGKRRAPAEIDSDVSRASKELADASTAVVAILRQELEAVRKQLDDLRDAQQVTNGKGYPEPGLPLIYDNQSEIKSLIEDLRELADGMSEKQDHSVKTQAELRETVDDLTGSVKKIEERLASADETTTPQA